MAGVTVGVADPDEVRARWQEVIGELPGVAFVADEANQGPVEYAFTGRAGGQVQVGGVRLVLSEEE